MTRRRLVLFSVLTALFCLLTILLLGETTARFFYSGWQRIPEPPPPGTINPYRPNPYVVNSRPYLFFHIPGALYHQKIGSRRNEYRINSRGFRGPAIAPKPPGRKRLLVIGDSVAEGHGIAAGQTFAALLNKQLAPSNREVINAGMQGASPLYFAANLERYLRLQPDALLILLHENDLYDDEMREQGYFDLPLLSDRPGLYSGGAEHSPGSVSALYALLQDVLSRTVKSSLEELIAEHQALPGVHAGSGAKKKLSTFYVPPAAFPGRWRMSSRYLDRVVRECDSRGIPVMLASLCTVTLAFPHIPEYISHCTSLDAHAASWAEEHEIPYHSLTTVMRRAFADNPLAEVLILNDFHPTAATHAMLADDLLPFVTAVLQPDDKHSY